MNISYFAKDCVIFDCISGALSHVSSMFILQCGKAATYKALINELIKKFILPLSSFMNILIANHVVISTRY